MSTVGTVVDREAPLFRGHIPELDGLRAVAAVLVLLNHFWPQSLSSLIWNVGQFAWVAMDSFFVLSGFLIAGILLDTRERADYYRSYYVRRSLRILPLYYCVLVYLICVATLWKGGEQYRHLVGEWGSPVWFFVYLGNFTTAAAGIKKSEALDICIIWSDHEAVAAGVFTTNKVRAAPVLWSWSTCSRRVLGVFGHIAQWPPCAARRASYCSTVRPRRER